MKFTDKEKQLINRACDLLIQDDIYYKLTKSLCDFDIYHQKEIHTSRKERESEIIQLFNKIFELIEGKAKNNNYKASKNNE